MSISINDVFEPVTELSVLSTMVRAIHIDEAHDAVMVIDLIEPPGKPYPVGLEELQLSLAAGDTKPVTLSVPEFLLVLEEDLDESAKRDRDDKWAVIAPLLDHGYPGQIFVRGEMGRMVGNRAAELGIQRKTIYRHLYRYWFYGQVRNALLKNYSAVGLRIAPINLKYGRDVNQNFKVCSSHQPNCSVLLINDAFEWVTRCTLKTKRPRSAVPTTRC